MRKLLWFHAFNRDTVVDVLDVLRTGPGYNPNPNCRTRQNEQALGLEPHAYAYIGRTVPSFGTVAFALPLDALDGTMSPFDTGGLVAHTPPVSSWTEEERRKFLADYSWTTRNRKTLLEKYPTTARAKLRAYLEGKRPSHEGPHALWSRTVATIWKNDSAEWRQWTWEGRCAKKMTLSQEVHAWSCSAPLYERICEHAEGVTNRKEQAFLDSLLSRYVRGGVSLMVASLRDEQAA